MRETRADTVQAVVLAVVLHLVLFGLMLAGLWWTRAPESISAAGSPVAAELVDANALSAAMQQALSERPEPAVPEPLPEPEPEPLPEPEPVAPPPQPEPEPRPQDAPAPPQQAPQESLPDPDTVDQDEVVAEPTPTPAEEEARLQEEKRRQEQIDLTERQRKQEEAEQKRRLAQQKLAELKRQQEQVRREREQLERNQRRIAESRAEQAAGQDTPAGTPPPGNEGVDPGMGARYAAAIQEAILRNWTRPENVPLGQVCRLTITQVRGGTVVKVDFSSSCPYDELGRRSVEAAVRKAEPLPYAGFESVFNRTLNLNFTAEDR